ncbi:MAG: alanine racemase [Desulfobacterales bacterium]|nr:alanine racemase [Desulfobacterales bacterium]
MEGALVTADIDLDRIRKNTIRLNRLTGPDTAFMAVVKANAYGHGAVQVAKTVLENGASQLGVARLHEAMELRNAGIESPILVFGHVDPDQILPAAEHSLTLSVFHGETAEAYSVQAVQAGKRLDIHLKVDTGMGRVGMIVGDPADRTSRNHLIRQIRQITELPGIDAKGIYTHFAAADHKDPAYTLEQIRRFDSLLNDLETERIRFQIRHAANSAGLIGFPQAHYDMVRPGISLYGLYPSEDVGPSRVNLIPAMTLRSIISSVKKVPKGFKVSYGMTYETHKPTVLASVPIGYGDGFSRCFSSNGTMLVNGCRAPIVGRVCMDQTMIDVGDIPGVQTGDPVVIIGHQKDQEIRADEWAERSGTINYEIVTALTQRVHRVYSESGSG